AAGRPRPRPGRGGRSRCLRQQRRRSRRGDCDRGPAMTATARRVRVRRVARRVGGPLLAALLAGGSAFVAMAPDRSSAGSTTHLTTIDFGYGDSIFNYDFTSQTADATRVDWAVSLLFYNNASINGVKSILASTYGTCSSSSIGCSTENARLNDGSGYGW